MANPLRTLDKIYLFYFLLIIPISLLIDVQEFWEPYLPVPPALKAVKEDWIVQGNDFLFRGDWSGPVETAWFRSFLYLELFFQLPTFFLASYGLYFRIPATRILILAYGASTSTTVIACLSTIYAATQKGAVVQVTSTQLPKLLAGYLPFLVLPLLMTVDSALVLSKLLATKRVKTA